MFLFAASTGPQMQHTPSPTEQHAQIISDLQEISEQSATIEVLHAKQKKSATWRKQQQLKEKKTTLCENVTQLLQKTMPKLKLYLEVVRSLPNNNTKLDLTVEASELIDGAGQTITKIKLISDDFEKEEHFVDPTCILSSNEFHHRFSFSKVRYNDLTQSKANSVHVLFRQQQELNDDVKKLMTVVQVLQTLFVEFNTLTKLHSEMLEEVSKQCTITKQYDAKLGAK